MRSGLPVWLPLAALVALAAVACSAFALEQQIELAWDDAGEKPLPVHGVAMFNFSLCVTGDGKRAQLDVGLLGEPPGWKHVLSAYGTTGLTSSNGTLNLTLLLNFVSNATLTVLTNGTPLMGRHPMTVHISTTYIHATNVTHALAVDVPRVTDFDIVPLDVPPSGCFGVYPLSQLTVRAALYNRGNAPDRFSISGNSSLSDDGWSLRFVSGVDGTGWTPPLPALMPTARPHIIMATLSVPAGVPAGIVCQVFLNATAESDPGMEARPAHFLVSCLPWSDFSIDLLSNEQVTARPGDVVEFRLSVANRGNCPDTYLFEALWDEVLCPGFIAVPNPRNLTVGPGGEAGFVCSVKVPDDAPIGLYSFQLMARSTVLPSATSTRLILVSVARVYGIELAFLEGSAFASPGDSIDFAGRMDNVGNGLDRIELTVVQDPQDWLFTLTPGWTELGPGGWLGVLLQVSVPAFFDAVPGPLATFTVQAWSSEGGLTVVSRLEVRLRPFERVEWLQGRERVTGPSAPTVAIGGCDINPYSQTVSWEAPGLELLSMGTVVTNVTLDATTEAAGLDVTLLPRWAVLAPNSTRTVRLEVSVGLDAEPGPHDVLISAGAEGAAGTRRTLVVHVSVILVDLAVRRPIGAEGPAVVLAPNGTAMARLGDDVRLLFTVENLGTVNVTDAAVHIMRHLPDGTTVVLNSYDIRLGVERQQELSYTWHADAAGDIWFDVVLELPDQTRRDNDGASVMVSIEGPRGEGKNPAPYADARVPVALVLILVVLAILVNGALSRRRGRPPRARPSHKADAHFYEHMSFF